MKCVPVWRWNGQRGYVDTETGEIFDRITEALGMWNLDVELRGLQAEAEAVGADGAAGDAADPETDTP